MARPATAAIALDLNVEDFAAAVEAEKAPAVKGPIKVVRTGDDRKDWRFASVEIKVIGDKKEVDPQTGAEKPKFDEAGPLRIGGVANANIIDRVNEQLDPRGCVLVNYTKNPVFLADHNYCAPLGSCPVVEVKDDGVYFEAEVGRPDLAPLTQLQKDKRSLIAQGVLKTVSVGFIPLEFDPPTFDDAGNMTKPGVYTKWELLEISLVSVPCNADAIFQMKELSMKTATGALPMNQPAGKKDGSAPAPGTNASDEPPMGTAGDYLKAIHEGIGHVKEYMVKMHEKVDGLHTKVDGLKPKDDTSNPPPKDDAVTQTPSGTDGKPEPVKALETRLTKLEASLEKLAGAVTVLVEKGLPTQQPKPGHF